MTLEAMGVVLPGGFPDDARVWIYQANRPLSEREVGEVNEQLLQFYSQWTSHGATVRGWASVVFQQFIVVIADEPGSGVSGCSTDGMVRVIKSIERQYQVQLFDRMTLTFLVEGKPQMLPLGQVKYAFEKAYIKAETPFFNNTITTFKELSDRWVVPVSESWLAPRLGL